MAKANPSDAPTAAQDDTIYAALELSRENWLVALSFGVGGKLSRHGVEAGDVAGVLRLIERMQGGRSLRVVSCYEAGPDGFWLHRRLTAAGIENVVIDPSSLRVDRRSRRRKTDRLDAQMMIQALIDWRGGNRHALRRVRVPSPELEDARRVERERARLMKERTAHANRMRGLLVSIGITANEEGSQFDTRGWPDWLAQQRQWNGQAVPAQLSAELVREHQRLMTIKQQLRVLEKTRPVLPPEQSRQLDTLERLRGIGQVISRGFVGEVLWHGFTNRRQVGAYVGLDPSPWRSGKVNRDQGISRAGNRRARSLMLEAAWLWLRHQPGSELSRWYYAKLGTNYDSRSRRIAAVALARKLTVLLWRIASTGIVPEDVQLKRCVAAAVN